MTGVLLSQSARGAFRLARLEHFEEIRQFDHPTVGIRRMTEVAKPLRVQVKSQQNQPSAATSDNQSWPPKRSDFDRGHAIHVVNTLLKRHVQATIWKHVLRASARRVAVIVLEIPVSVYAAR